MTNQQTEKLNNLIVGLCTHMGIESESLLSRRYSMILDYVNLLIEDGVQNGERIKKDRALQKALLNQG